MNHSPIIVHYVCYLFRLDIKIAYEHAISWGMEWLTAWNISLYGIECLRASIVSGHSMSRGMQCLGAWNVLGHAMSWDMQCVGACNVSGHAMSQGMQ